MTSTGPANADETLSSNAVVRLTGVSLRYGETVALDSIDLELPAGGLVGLIGPDGVGKSSLLALAAGVRRVQQGRVETLHADMANAQHRRRVCPRIAFLPQGLGKSLYATLSVRENIEFFGRLFGRTRLDRERRIAELLQGVGLAEFTDRPAGKLSGGMKQKLSLCCALIHDPDLLVLDEPTTGVDPLSRRQFWELVELVRAARPGMSVVAATSDMNEASRFDWLAAMDAGRLLAVGSPRRLLEQTGAASLEEAFVALLPREKRPTQGRPQLPPREPSDRTPAIEAQNLSKRFGEFTAVDRVTFRIERGEIFGFLGSNGCGKTTTMKMLTGLLSTSEGRAWLFGRPIDATNLDVRRRVGYMSQTFSLYSELTVRQNLKLHAELFQVPERELAARIESALQRFGLGQSGDALPESLPLGLRQRLSLAVALIHRPDLLILDEPTSGVDPVARENFWRLLIELSRRDKVTIFISTHFVNEAERCDRVSLMHAGRVLVSDSPAALMERRGVQTLEDAFIAYLSEAVADAADAAAPMGATHAATPPQLGSRNSPSEVVADATTRPSFVADEGGTFSVHRMATYSWRETLELSRDSVRLTLAVLGSAILMMVMGYGVTMDVENLTFAVLDRDQTSVSREYALNIAGSRYFSERPPLVGYDDLDRRMRDGEISMALEIPPNFGRHIGRGESVQIGVWLDGAMPQRAETVRGYVQGMHAQWLADVASRRFPNEGRGVGATIETRFRYNPDVKSIRAMVPAMIPLLLMMIPAMLTAVAVVREKELGSIVNFYVTPTRPAEFLLGKQIPYAALGLLNFLLLTTLAATLLGVPLTGSFAALCAGAVLYVVCATALGLLISTFMRSQMAAIFGTVVLTVVPATLFSGIIHPVSSLEGVGALIGQAYPTTHFLTISRGTFGKGLEFAELYSAFLPLLIAAPLLTAVSIMLLQKQEG